MTNQILIQLEPIELENLVKNAISDYFRENPITSAQGDNSMMTISEAAQFLNCSIPNIYAKVSQKKIPFHKQGKRLYFTKSGLVEWIKGKEMCFLRWKPKRLTKWWCLRNWINTWMMGDQSHHSKLSWILNLLKYSGGLGTNFQSALSVCQTLKKWR